MIGLGRVKQYLRERRIASAHLDHFSRHTEEYDRYREILDRFHASGGLNHGYQSYKLFSLHALLEKETPASILELGTGTTTPIFADYVRSRHAFLTIVDESAKWLENSRVLAGIEAGDTRFKLIHAERNIVNRVLSVTEIGYDVSYERSFDFVFIDGPSLNVDGKKQKNAVNSDIFRILAYGYPRVIVVDMRVATVRELQRRLQGDYDVNVSDLIENRITSNYRYFSVFKKRKP